MVVVNDNWSPPRILYRVGYFYLTNGASIILIGDDRLILIRANTVALLEIVGVVVIWA